jgi:hypothetical protein
MAGSISPPERTAAQHQSLLHFIGEGTVTAAIGSTLLRSQGIIKPRQ